MIDTHGFLRDTVSAMHTFRVSLCVSLVACALVGSCSRPVYAQAAPSKEIAKRLFEEGAAFEKRGDWAAALEKYYEAEQITVTPGLRFHVGYCLEMQGKLNSAVQAYEAADQHAREANRPEVHAAAIARLEPLRPRIPQIAIRLVTHGQRAQVHLDGMLLSSVLLDGMAFPLDPGEHHVTALAAGHEPFSRKVQVPEAVTTTVDVMLVPDPPPARRPPVSELPSAPSTSSAGVPIATTAGAVTLAVTGVVFYALAAGAQSDAKAKCLQQPTCDERSGVRTLDALALGSFIGAASLGVLSAVLWTSRESRGTSAALVAKPTALGGSIRLEASF